MILTERNLMMKIAIINLSIRPHAQVKYLPIGLAYIMTSLKEAGYKFEYIDQDLYDLSEAEVLERLGGVHMMWFYLELL